MKFNDSELLSELRAIDEEAANRYLEYVVVHKRSPKRALHQELLERLLDSVKREIEDDGVKYHLEELGVSQHHCKPYRIQADASCQTPNFVCDPKL